MKWLAIVALLSGCDWLLGLREFGNKQDAAYVVDADNFFDAPPFGTVCVGNHLGVHVCFQQTKIAPLTIAQSQTIDTSDAGCVIELLDHVKVCVVAGTTLTIASQVTANGPYPLVLVGVDEVTITGTVDASSAGANDGGCPQQSNGQQMIFGGRTAGGGAGGSYAGRGGAGGQDENDVAIPALPLALVTTLRGGCRGGDGGADDTSNGAGAGGVSGGAVYVASNGPISIAGTILATGAPGGGTGNSNPVGYPGGGGGGSGGLIAIDGAMVSLTASSLLLAAGASGGGGGDGLLEGEGGAVPFGSGRAPGGISTGNGGNGGLSSGNGSVDGLDGNPTTLGDPSNKGGAGGGGGAAGFIYLYPTSTVSHGTVVPPPG